MPSEEVAAEAHPDQVPDQEAPDQVGLVGQENLAPLEVRVRVLGGEAIILAATTLALSLFLTQMVPTTRVMELIAQTDVLSKEDVALLKNAKRHSTGGCCLELSVPCFACLPLMSGGREG